MRLPFVGSCYKLTLHVEVDPVADGGGDPVRGDAQVRAGVAAAGAREGELVNAGHSRRLAWKKIRFRFLGRVWLKQKSRQNTWARGGIPID